MSTEDRITALEQGLRGVQSEFLVHLSESNRQIASLNKVMTAQELNGRDIDHNLTMLLGMVTSQGKDINVMQVDLGTVKEQVADIKQDMNDRFETQGKHLEAQDKRLDTLDSKIDQVLKMLSILTNQSE